MIIETGSTDRDRSYTFELLLKPCKYKEPYTWQFKNKEPILLPKKNYCVRKSYTEEIYMCEEYETKVALSLEEKKQICDLINEVNAQKHPHILEYAPIDPAYDFRDNTLKLYANFTKRTSLRSKVTHQARNYAPPSELYALFRQLHSVLPYLYACRLYTTKINGQRIMNIIPFLSPSAIYLFSQENYKIGLSTAFMDGDPSIFSFISPEISPTDKYVNISDEPFEFNKSELTKQLKEHITYSIGTIFIYYSTLREPAVSRQISNPFENESTTASKKGVSSIDDFERSGTLKKPNNNQNPYNSVSTDVKLMEDLNTRIKKMLLEKRYEEFFDSSRIKSLEEMAFEQHLEIFDHTLWYNMNKYLTKSLEELIRGDKGENIKSNYLPDKQMDKLIQMAQLLSKSLGEEGNKDKFKLDKGKQAAPDILVYDLTIKLDLDKSAPQQASNNADQKNPGGKNIQFEITTLFKKNCIIIKAWIDNLSLSVEFGDDLTHLSSMLSHLCPSLSAEMDEQRRIVFRVANTLNNFESFLDPLIHTIDVIVITSISMFKKLGECIKQEKFGKIAKTSKQIAREIEHKISLYLTISKKPITQTKKEEHMNIEG